MKSNSLFKLAVAAALATSTCVHAQSTVSYGTLGPARTQTTTTANSNSMSQTSIVLSGPAKVGNASVSGFVGSNTTVSGGYSVGGSGQPITNNTRGSHTSSSYQIGIDIRKGK